MLWVNQKLFLVLWLDQKLSLIPPPASQVHLVLVPLELRVVYQVVMYQVFLGLVVLCQV